MYYNRACCWGILVTVERLKRLKEMPTAQLAEKHEKCCHNTRASERVNNVEQYLCMCRWQPCSPSPLWPMLPQSIFDGRAKIYGEKYI